VKQWSRSGHLRSKLSENPNPVRCDGQRQVHSVAWGGGSKVAFCTGQSICVAPLQAAKQVRWRAHQGKSRAGITLCPAGTILSLDWNEVSSLLVSGAEDCKCAGGSDP